LPLLPLLLLLLLWQLCGAPTAELSRATKGRTNGKRSSDNMQPVRQTADAQQGDGLIHISHVLFLCRVRL